MKALEIHIVSHSEKREDYTRGIMRGVKRQCENGSGKSNTSSARTTKVRQRKNRFFDYDQREYDYEVLEHLEQLRLMGTLDEMRPELIKNPRYAKYMMP